MYALNALKGQFVGQGGGDEARRSEFLSGLQQRLGRKKGLSVFNDLRQFKNRELATSVDGRFPYGTIPKQPKGSVILDHNSFTQTPAVADAKLAAKAPTAPTHASNTLMITADHSKTGEPLMVGGPQIGYFYPGLTYEIDMHAGDLQWRGATSAPFPGYALIGRGEDFAHTLTSASGDIIDQFVEKLCNGSDTMYEYKGQCLPMGDFDAGTLDGQPVAFWRRRWPPAAAGSSGSSGSSSPTPTSTTSGWRGRSCGAAEASCGCTGRPSWTWPSTKTPTRRSTGAS